MEIRVHGQAWTWLDGLLEGAKAFCLEVSAEEHPKLFGVSDGKAIGTYLEQRFKDALKQRFSSDWGSAGRGGLTLDQHRHQDDERGRPAKQSPFKSSRQKVYGLGHNLLVFVYEKKDSDGVCKLKIVHCFFVEKKLTADYSLTSQLRRMLSVGADKRDIIAALVQSHIPANPEEHERLAEEILCNPPPQGYLTISNALQWRLQYGRIVAFADELNGVIDLV